jgi:hypothetical protein
LHQNLVYHQAVYSLDPATLALTQTAALQNFFLCATYNPASHTLLAVDGTTLYAIDPHTGATNAIGTVPVPPNGSHISDIGVGADGRFLYALYYQAGVGELQTYLVRFDPANLAPPVSTALNPAYGILRGLVPIPGTTAFYVSTGFNPAGVNYTGPAPAFGILDTSGFTFTTLASASLGAYSPVTPLIFQNFTFAPEPPAPAGPLSYTIRDLCFPSSCTASVLNDNGDIAGPRIDNARTPFTVDAGKGVTYPAIPSGSFVTHMNNNGVIVGGYPNPAPYSAPPGAVEYLAYAYVPKLPLFYDLSALTNYAVNSSPLTWINNLGDITGPAPNVPGYGYVGAVFGITDDRILIAALLIARPGSPPIFFPPALQIFAFNRFGEVVGLDTFGNNGFLYRPDFGLIPLPATQVSQGETLPVAINDSGLILFNTGPNALLYDSSGGIGQLSGKPVPIHAFVPPSSGWSNLIPVALNNAGQLLVQGVNVATGRSTSLLLTPVGLPSQAISSGIKGPSAFSRPRQVDAVKAADCQLKTVNGAAIDCSHLAGTHPRAVR